MDATVKNFLVSQWMKAKGYEDLYDVFPRYRDIQIYADPPKILLYVRMRMGGNAEWDYLLGKQFDHLREDDFLDVRRDIDRTYIYYVYDITDFVPPNVVKTITGVTSL